jgi:hypothetical protein
MLGCYANWMISEHTRENVHKPHVSQNNHQFKPDLVFTYLKPTEINLMVYNSPYFLQFFSQCKVQDSCQILMDLFLCIPSDREKIISFNHNFYMAINVTLEKFQLSYLLLVRISSHRL